MSDILDEETNLNISSPAICSHRVASVTESSTAVSFQRPPIENLAPRGRARDFNVINNPSLSLSMPRDRSPHRQKITLFHFSIAQRFKTTLSTL